MIKKSACDASESENRNLFAFRVAAFRNNKIKNEKVLEIRLFGSVENDLKKIIVVFALSKFLMDLTGRRGPRIWIIQFSLFWKIQNCMSKVRNAWRDQFAEEFNFHNYNNSLKKTNLERAWREDILCTRVPEVSENPCWDYFRRRTNFLHF